MRRFKWFVDYTKEEKWLCEMAEKGYELEDVSWGHKFKLSNPQNTIIKIDYRTFKYKEDFIDYCSMFEDSGWSHISGTKNSGTQYFKKISDSSEDEIFSDGISKAGRYKRLSRMFSRLAISYLPLAVLVLSSEDNLGVKTILNPKLLFLTPGLWEMTGKLFWLHFLFEAPFALMRALACMGIPLVLLISLGFYCKAKILYYKQIKASI